MTPLVIDDPQSLKSRGIVTIPIPATLLDHKSWASRLVANPQSPLLMFADNEEPRYRNILDEPDFPFASLLHDMAPVIRQSFDVTMDELRLDDAFAIHYNTEQARTHGAKHVDPSDITINMCLDASEDSQGSHVLFHGVRPLAGRQDENQPEDEDKHTCCLVRQRPGFATLHWGAHPHETTSLECGHRTNVILTLCYKDKSRSNAASRSCYHV